MNAQIANASGFPSGETSPDTHKPFVIYVVAVKHEGEPDPTGPRSASGSEVIQSR